MADYEDIKVKDLVINNMSQEKFDELKAAGELQPDQIYFTPESGGASGDYLSLSGGTLTGDLNVSGTNLLEFDGKYAFKSAGSNSGRVVFGSVDNSSYFNPKIIFAVTGYGALSPANDQATLGYLTDKWKKTYTTIINNGADIAVPTEGGTLARLEDLEGLGGLPDQTDNAGKFLMTDGTTASWGKALVNNSSQMGSLSILGTVSSGTHTLAIGEYSLVNGWGATAMGSSANALSARSLAIGYYAAVGANAERAIQLGSGSNSDANTFKVSNANGNFELMDANGNVPRERLKNLVEVLPTADNGYTTVKNFGNGYVEITGYASIGTVGASTGSEVQIDLPAGYTMADTNYWVNIAPTSETTMFDFKAEAKARSTTHFMVAYKNEDTVTGLTAAGVYWEVRGMLATTEA